MANKSDKESHAIRDGVIVGVIVLAIGGLLSWLTPFLSWVGSIFSAAWAHLMSSISVPRWLFYPLAVVTFTCFMVRIVKMFGKKDPRRQYTSDIFHGMNWTWYLDGDLDPHNLWCFCPDDETRLVCTDNLFCREETTFRCETCGRKWGPIHGNRQYALQMIERQIERKINTGEWKKAAGSSAT